MENLCNRCGKCCEAISFAYSLEEMKEYADNGNKDAVFIIENWVEISEEEAFKINPFLQLQIKRFREKGLHKFINGKFYKCNQYNNHSKLCLAHDNKPKVCSDYPFYNRTKLPKGYLMYDENCGYNIPELFEDEHRIEK
jgi:Fe-S-cluster containining protein